MFQNAADYNAGRIISYTIIGGILGGIGAFTGMAGTLQTSSFFQGLLKLLAGALMVLIGINTFSYTHLDVYKRQHLLRRDHCLPKRSLHMLLVKLSLPQDNAH